MKNGTVLALMATFTAGWFLGSTDLTQNSVVPIVMSNNYECTINDIKSVTHERYKDSFILSMKDLVSLKSGDIIKDYKVTGKHKRENEIILVLNYKYVIGEMTFAYCSQT